MVYNRVWFNKDKFAITLGGGQMTWIAQPASEFASIPANIAEIARYNPCAIYHHGTHTDNSWHSGQIEAVRDIVKAILKVEKYFIKK